MNEELSAILNELKSVNKLIIKETEVSEKLDFREKEYRESLKREIDLLKLKLKILENLEEASV